MIDLDTTGAIWRARLNRPDKANALTRAMLADLADAAEAAHGAARAFVVTGTGKAFSAGMDLGESTTGLATDPVWERVSGAIAALPCLTVAALNGTVAGGAMGMVLACDLRIAVPQARFLYPVMRLGFLPQPSDPKRLCALVGPARAMLILMAGQKLSAQEALAMGLVDRVTEPDTLMETAEAFCADSVTAAPDHAAAIKRMILDGEM